MKLSVLVPVFQEERTVALVLRQLMALDVAALEVELEVIVCDDGSTDNSIEEVRDVQRSHANIKLLAHERNRGKGRAIRTALEHATGEFVLIQDADLEYDTQAYPPLLAAARAGADVVYGSRFLRRSYPSGMHPTNFVANRVLSATANILYGHRITDEATCLKLVRTDLIRSLDLRCERFEFCPELTAKLGLLGVNIREVPVDYQARDADHGKKITWIDGLQALAVLAEYSLQPQAGLPCASIGSMTPRLFANLLGQGRLEVAATWRAVDGVVRELMRRTRAAGLRHHEPKSADDGMAAPTAHSGPAAVYRSEEKQGRSVRATDAWQPVLTDSADTVALNPIGGRQERTLVVGP